VGLSAEFAADLAVLTQALDDPDVDLGAALESLAAALQRAVASYRAMTMTIVLDGRELSFTVQRHDGPNAAEPKPATSLLIPLAAGTGTRPTSTLVLYAANPGAFVDLAADLSHALSAGPDALVLDAHLPAPAPSSRLDGLDGQVLVNQAIGVLVGRGHTPEAAGEELHRLADLDHGDLHAAAAQILHSTARPPEPR
jgi:hypothetical protein